MTKLWELLETDKLPLANNLFLDSTCVMEERASLPAFRAHQHAAGAAKAAGGQWQQAFVRVSVDCQLKYTSVA
ncbi:hypothetical protein H8E77_29875 [bacterium]|nr:hypothetical protein [bacterium]